jgi:anti-anti-sigma factor
MRLTTEEFRGIQVFGLIGKLNAVTSEELWSALEKFVKTGQEKVIFDLTETEFVSSAGLRVFYRLANLINSTKQVAFFGVNEHVINVFRAVAFDEDYRLLDTIEEASDYLSQD